MADKVFQDDVLDARRYICDCLHAGHSLTITIEQAGKEKLCSLDFFMAPRTRIAYRLKQAWKVLWGREAEIADFILRPSDNADLVSFLSQLVTSPNMAGTGDIVMSPSSDKGTTSKGD